MTLLGGAEIGDHAGAGVGLFAAAGYFGILVWRRRVMDREALRSRESERDSPPSIHHALGVEIDAWRDADLLKEHPVVDAVWELSGLIIAEGEEDEQDRPVIEAFFAKSMTPLIGDLVSLRKLLRGETYLTEAQMQELEAMKSKVEDRKDSLQALYQQVVG